jgi:hypothetical protein
MKGSLSHEKSRLFFSDTDNQSSELPHGIMDKIPSNNALANFFISKRSLPTSPSVPQTSAVSVAIPVKG